MQYSAILVHQYATREFPDAGPRASAEHCVIFHTHRRERVCAPDPYRRMYRNIEAVCRNIARGWEGILPPPNFAPDFAEYR
jgi:hypothetical protein